jgi:putative spermidine/putrescine transport system permease protein
MTVDTTSPGQRMPVPPHRDTLARRGSITLSRHPRLRLTLMLFAPLPWLGLIYILALAALLITALLITALWTVDSFTGTITRS